MMHCPLCGDTAYTRTSRRLTENVKESYYQCRNMQCSATFKTMEQVVKICSGPSKNSADYETEKKMTIPQGATLGKGYQYE